ncbi:MAG: GNAT family N-acetyltransferase [Clostridia bacterium]|nr:GNAT family N-acetyltransferase [Clostridia bacterium]
MLQYQLYTASNPIGDARFDAFFALLADALPTDEHRSHAAQKALLDEPAYAILTGEEGGTIRAIMAVWEFAGFRYVEHFAVDPALRGHGVGAAMLGEYLRRDERRVVLEVEPPETAIAARRIGFYERCGLSLSRFPYAQPPLNPGDGMLPLMLMSSGGTLTDAEAAAVRDTLYREVYHWPVG